MAETLFSNFGDSGSWTGTTDQFGLPVFRRGDDYVVSDEIFWNQATPMGEDLQNRVQQIKGIGGRAGLTITPYAVLEGKATAQQLLDEVKRSGVDFVALNMYMFGDNKFSPEQGVAWAKEATQALKDAGVDVKIVTGGWVPPGTDPSVVRDFNNQLSKISGVQEVVNFGLEDAPDLQSGGFQSLADPYGNVARELQQRIPGYNVTEQDIQYWSNHGGVDAVRQTWPKEGDASIPAFVSDSAVSSALPTVSQNLTPEQLQQFTNYLTPETLKQIYGGLADDMLPGGFRPQLGYEWESSEAMIGGGPGRATIAGYSSPITDGMYNAYSPTGEFLGRYKAEDDGWKALLPIAMAIGGQFLFGGGLGGGAAAGAGATAADIAALADVGMGASTSALGGATAGLSAAEIAALADVGMGTNTSLLGAAGADAAFIAADAAQLAAQTGNNIAAINQNLLAAGVSSDVASVAAHAAATGASTAEIASSILSTANSTSGGLFTGGSAADLASGGITTTTGAGTGATTGATTGTGAGTSTGATTGTGTGTGAATGAGSAVGNALTSLFSNPSTLSALLGALTGGAAGAAAGGGGGTPSVGSIPTQGVPTMGPEYYQAMQQYYNAYMPNAPRDVSTPLQQWYENKFNPNAYTVPSGPSFGDASSWGNMPAAMQTTMPTTQATTPTAQAFLPAALQQQTVQGAVNPAAQAQLAGLLSNPNLAGLPAEAASRISAAVNSPRSYQDVIASGLNNTVDVSKLSPEVQRAYDLYQQSMILGANRSNFEAALGAAGINLINPGADFAKYGLAVDAPTQEALAKYAPLALNQFAKTGGGALTYTVDPSTVPTNYVAPTNAGLMSGPAYKSAEDITKEAVQSYANTVRSTFKGTPEELNARIAAEATRRGLNPADFI